MGCGGTCPLCRTYAEEKSRRHRRPAAGNGTAASTAERPAKDPRYSWLPP
jgi:hypothetical protein